MENQEGKLYKFLPEELSDVYSRNYSKAISSKTRQRTKLWRFRKILGRDEVWIAALIYRQASASEKKLSYWLKHWG